MSLGCDMEKQGHLKPHLQEFALLWSVPYLS